MTREENIKNFLTELVGMIDNGSQKDLDRADEISNIILKALEQEPCEDCVSRTELKKWLDMNFSFGGASRKLELFDRLDKELTPVKAQEPKILDRDEVARRLGTVDVYTARAWTSLLKDLELLGLGICEVKK